MGYIPRSRVGADERKLYEFGGLSLMPALETLESNISGLPSDCGSTLKLPLVSRMTEPTSPMLAIPFDRTT